MTEAKLLRVSEFAEEAGCSVSHCYNQLAAGAIPCVRIGGAVRIPRVYLDQVIEQEMARIKLTNGEVPDIGNGLG